MTKISKMTFAFVAAGFVLASALSETPAQDSAPSPGSAIIGTWRTMIGLPSTYQQPSASVVFTTTFAADGSYRTTAVTEGGNGYLGAAGTYVSTGHYQILAPMTLQFRLESSVLCVAENFCSPGIPPGEQIGGVVSATLQFDGNNSFIADGQRWTRVQVAPGDAK